MAYCTLVGEDDLSVGVLETVVAFSNPELIIHAVRVMSGFGNIKKNIHALNNASRAMPYIVLTDLDRCGSPRELINNWMGKKPPNRDFVFRVAVREVEAWLLADREGFARFLGLSKTLIPVNPDEISDPKLTVFGLTKRSRKPDLKRSILPAGTASQGPDYNSTLMQFVNNGWNIPEAIRASESLRRASNRIAQLGD